MDLNIYAFVGLIMLIGIVEKNAIMQIDFALEAERQHGLTPEKAIYEGCLIRFRPIMMTTMAALLGAVPIALGYGAGGEARQPLGLVVVGGLLFSQLVTLVPDAGVLHLHVGGPGEGAELAGQKAARQRDAGSRLDAGLAHTRDTNFPSLWIGKYNGDLFVGESDLNVARQRQSPSRPWSRCGRVTLLGES